MQLGGEEKGGRGKQEGRGRLTHFPSGRRLLGVSDFDTDFSSFPPHANPGLLLLFPEGGGNEENFPKFAVILQAPYALA